jgi:DNA-binding transcriptional MerR regulator
MKIGKFAQLVALPESTIRYYEKNNLIILCRDKNGNRIFEKADVEWIRFIRRLKDMGMPLKKIQRYSKLRYQGDTTMKERMDLLQDHKSIVLHEQKKWAEYLENLNNKINFYQNALQKK